MCLGPGDVLLGISGLWGRWLMSSTPARAKQRNPILNEYSNNVF